MLYIGLMLHFVYYCNVANVIVLFLSRCSVPYIALILLMSHAVLMLSSPPNELSKHLNI